MSLSLAPVHPGMSTRKRLLLLGAAIALGFIVGIVWNLEISTWAYDGVVALFTEPGVQITSLGMAVGLGYLLGLVHCATV